MATAYEAFREMLKQNADIQTFAGDHVYWFDVPASVFQSRGPGKGCVAFRMLTGSPGELVTCGSIGIQSATFEVYAWSTDGCSSQIAAGTIAALLGHRGTYFGTQVSVIGATYSQDAKSEDSYGCGVALEVHFSAS